MLTGLYIQNLAVIEKAYIEFDIGLNVFTGETGAGKSIVIDAINAILGGRTSREIVRNGEKKAVISAIFTNVPDQVKDVVNDFGIEIENDELVIQREISVDGKSLARVCGIPVTMTMLKEIGVDLITINGQHEHQKLLSPEQHIRILDRFGGLEETVKRYDECYSKLIKIREELDEINKEQSHKEQQIESLTYQIEEIEGADVELHEEEELEKEKKAILNATKIAESLQTAHDNLQGTEDIQGAVDLVAEASEALSVAKEYYSDVSDVALQIEDLSIQLKDVAVEVSSYTDGVDFDVSSLEAIEERLDEIFKLKRKYGGSIEAMFMYYHKAKEQLAKIEMYDVRLNELIVDQNKIASETQRLADKLTEGRKKASEVFVTSVSKELEFLDMPNVKMQVNVEGSDYGHMGKDKVEFLISTNLGEPPKPMAKIASGGELSRIMLSIKNVLADKDEIPTLIFDEVDTGVSGSAAQKIGLKLKQAGKDRQILCVTHSAQIAALAECHFLIRKSVENERTYTKVHKLEYEDRKIEVARIMGTGVVSRLLLDNADEMLKNGQKLLDNKL